MITTNISTANARRLFMLACAAGALTFAASETTTDARRLAFQGGSATFLANTNVAAISVKGKSTALEGEATVRRNDDGLRVEHIEAHLPVKMLTTGMGLRDEHMRKHIFTTSDGKLPDLRFEGVDAACPGSGREFACQLSGTLAIRGAARPFLVQAKIREDGPGFKVSADATVRLSAYGIEQPSQFGVKTTDEVHLHFEFAARAANEISMAGGRR